MSRQNNRLLGSEGRSDYQTNPLDFNALKSKIADLKHDAKPSSWYNPFENTSLCQQINQEIRDLQAFVVHIENNPDKETHLIQRLAQTYAAIEAETKEANASFGSRFKAIEAIRDQLSDDQKTIFNLHYQQLKSALHYAKYGRIDMQIGCLAINSKSLLHPIRSCLDAREVSRDYNSLQDQKILVLTNNALEEISVTEWARAKYALIDSSIRERIKLKLLSLACIATAWGVHHEMAHHISAAFAAKGAAGTHAAVAPTPVLMGAAPTTAAPTAATASSSSAGHAIASAIGGCITAAGGLISTCAKDCKCGDCCGNCDCISASSCPSCDCGSCVNCVGNGCSTLATSAQNVCGNACDFVNSFLGKCFELVRCETNCCSQTLQNLCACLEHVCNAMTNCCCTTSSPYSYNSGNSYTFYNCNCNCGNSGCGGRCCDDSCTNPFARKTHSDVDVAAAVRIRYNLPLDRYHDAVQ